MSLRVPLIAVTLSAALHAAAAFFVATTPDRRLGRVEATTLSLVEIEVEARPPPAPPESPKVVEPPRTPPARPRPPVKAVDVVVSTPDEPPLVFDSPRNESPQLVAPKPERPSLIPGGTFALSLDAGVFVPDDEPTGLHAPAISGDLVKDLTRETIGRGKVDRGLVHPYYVQLGKTLLKSWDADRAVSKKGLAGYGEQFVQNTKVFNEIWLDKAAQFGATGSAIDAPVSNDNASRRTATITNNIQGIGGVDLEARKEVSRQMREQFKATRRATIRVTQEPSGKLVRVELIAPSNDASVDREALTDVRAAAERLPPPPAEAIEGRTTLVSTWSFELVVSISPPIPTFTFEFDEALGFIDARLPLDRRIYKKVRLVSVD